MAECFSFFFPELPWYSEIHPEVTIYLIFWVFSLIHITIYITFGNQSNQPPSIWPFSPRLTSDVGHHRDVPVAVSAHRKKKWRPKRRRISLEIAGVEHFRVLSLAREMIELFESRRLQWLTCLKVIRSNSLGNFRIQAESGCVNDHLLRIYDCLPFEVSSNMGPEL